MPIIKLNDTTYKNIAKENPKYFLEVIYGDDKDLTKFQPQQKIQRWDNEANVSIRLIEDKDEEKETPTIIEEDGKIKHIKSKRECHFYNLPASEEHSEGASEFEVILKKDPRKDKTGDYDIEFSLVDKDVDYFRQEALTPEEIAQGASRPENVEGSYAIYAKTTKINWTGGKEYKCGKIGHIFRPKNIDAVGKESWGELKIDKGILSVTIPQNFLDNAVYPVRHAAGLTFGYTTAGGTNDYWTKDEFYGSVFTSPADMGTVSSVSQYVRGTNGTHFKDLFVLHSNLNIATNGISSPGTISAENTAAWETANYSTAPILSANTDYVIGNIIYEANTFRRYYDTGSANQEHEDLTNNYTTPTNPTDATHGTHYPSTAKFSIYATYTAGGANVKQINISDSWKSITSIQLNISDSWKTVTHVWVNISDTWKSLFSLTLIISAFFKNFINKL